MTQVWEKFFLNIIRKELNFFLFFAVPFWPATFGGRGTKRVFGVVNKFTPA
jgi:hypothetical protein